jgi:hypothetical protein
MSDRLDGAIVQRVFAEGLLFRRLGLLVDEGKASLVISDEICGRSFAAQIAIDAL